MLSVFSDAHCLAFMLLGAELDAHSAQFRIQRSRGARTPSQKVLCDKLRNTSVLKENVEECRRWKKARSSIPTPLGTSQEVCVQIQACKQACPSAYSYSCRSFSHSTDRMVHSTAFSICGAMLIELPS